MKLETSEVQLWKNGIMLSVIPREEAEEMVREGLVRVICSQAVEWKRADGD